MKTFDASKLPEDIVKEIQSYKQNKLTELAESGVIFNKLIREDILRLLDRECIVVYYPIDDSESNGFHKTYRMNGRNYHLVFINTSQYREKQIFTAAHELGHVWKVDRYLKKKLGREFDFDTCERLMNRFAAEMLMPEEIFRQYVEREMERARDRNLEKTPERGRIITVADMIGIVVGAMNEFFVPYKSVLYRLYELELSSEKGARILWGENEMLPKADIDAYCEKYAKEQGYDRLFKQDGRKLIDGLKERLDQASADDVLPEEWLDAFYKRFDLQRGEREAVLDNQIE